MQQGTSSLPQHPSMNIINQANIASSAVSSASAPVQQQQMSNVVASPQQHQQPGVPNGMHNMAPGGVYPPASQQQTSQQQQPHYQMPQQYSQQTMQQQQPQQYPQQVPQQLQQQQHQQMSQQVHSQPAHQFSQPQQAATAAPQQQILAGGWQSDRDIEDRKKMIAKIVQLLQQRKPNAPQEWLKKLPQMAKRLEESLYRSATSFEVYNDLNTLKYRLQQLAMNIGMKTQQAKQRVAQQNKVQQSQPAPQASSAIAQPQQYQPQQQVIHQPSQQQPHQPYQIPQTQQQQQQQQPMATHTYAYPNQNSGSLPQQAQFGQQQIMTQQKIQYQPQQPQNPSQSQPQNRIVNLNEINSFMAPSGIAQQQTLPQQLSQPQRQQVAQQVSMPSLPPMTQQVQQQQHPTYPQQQQQQHPQQYAQVQQHQQFSHRPQQVQMQQPSASVVAQQQLPHHSQLQSLQQVQPLPQQIQMAAPTSNAAGNATNASSAVNNSAAARSASDRQQVLRHQQQRLLLLRHAAKCPHEDNRCPVTPHCAGMKRLWKHIAECKDQKCLVPHCVSSRYVLSHYHRCRDVKCPVCGPVREAIHRSHEKAKMLQKQREQQQADGIQPVQQQPPANSTHFAAAATHITNAQPALPFPSQVPLAGSQQQQMIQEPGNLQQGQHPGSQQQLSTAQQQAPAAKRQKTAASGGGNRKPSSTGAFQQHLYPSQVQKPQLQPQLQPIVTPSQSNPQITPMPADSGCQRPSNATSNGPTQQGFVYNQAMVSSSSAVAPLSSVLSSSRVGPQLVNGQVIMPKHEGPKPQEDHTLINTFTIEQIETHIASLSTGLNVPPAKIKIKCGEVLKTLQNHQHAWVFNSPVDPVELGLPDYFQIIKRPMDLGTIKKRLENGCYHSVEEFQADTLLTFDNAMLYNQEGSVVHNMAKEMKDLLVPELEKLMTQLHLEEEEKRKNGDACSLCGCEKLLFEPPVFYCNGLNCPNPGKRIRRNAYFYVNKNNQYHWCHQCWGELSEKPIEVGDVVIKKHELAKKKNDEIHEESWVQCDKCERWIHQICALFNTRQNKDQRSEYVCPTCTIDDRKRRGTTEGISTTPMAEDLPRTKLSEWLENHVRQKMKEKFEELSNEANVLSEEGLPMEPTKVITMGGNITIRQVTSMDRKLDVRERMLSRYGFKNYPSEFPFRCKCFIVFQNLDGVDVILFGLYVYEHGADSPPPNHRSVYISYLDSVHYMRPRKMRTFIYHEILISYLDYVRRKGFTTAHIWACPPLKGDDYILYAKPEDQKTPKDDRLRQWYIDMLIEAQKRGIVGKLTNMYDLYFADEKNDATAVPYMDGDYFPAEVENVIKDIEEGKSSKTSDSGKKSKKKAKAKQKGNRGGTRSTGLDEEALKASGILPAGLDSKSIEEGARDYVMKKVGETIQPMKESFIVAFLTCKNAKACDLEVPKEILEARKKMGVVDSVKESEKVIMDDSDTFLAIKSDQEKSPEPLRSEPKEVKEEPPENSEAESLPPTELVASNEDNGNSASEILETKPLPENGVVVSEQNNQADTIEPLSTEKPNESKVDSGTENASKKRDADGEVKPDVASSNSDEVVRDKSGKLVKVIDDDEEEMDCEFLNNRQAFLNLCQGNHYQFDQLRRAKHTSMMVLWHLHNRDAPKFVQQCANCSREILTGYRYHCQTCPDFDQCQECYSNPNTIRHPHPLQPTPVGGQQSHLTEAQRQERQRHIQLHMQLLQHAASCHSPNCPSGNCNKMKGLLRHGSTCTVKHTGGCNICKRIWALLQIHARQCKLTSCAVPNCMAIRERIRQLTKQQQAMDDRRRQEMNRTYRAAGAR